MIGIDLFSGAGGMSLGATLAGVDVAYAVEANLNACRTYARNHVTSELLHKPIEQITRLDFRSLRRRKRDLVVFGGPPCQGFSTSNQRTRTKANPQNWLFQEYIRVVRLIEPDWVVFENVTGITQTAHGDFLELVCDQLADAGYPTVRCILNAADFGVPQRRSRLFLVAHRSGGHFTVPTPCNNVITVGEALIDLPTLSNGANRNVLPYGRNPAFTIR